MIKKEEKDCDVTNFSSAIYRTNSFSGSLHQFFWEKDVGVACKTVQCLDLFFL